MCLLRLKFDFVCYFVHVKKIVGSINISNSIKNVIFAVFLRSIDHSVHGKHILRLKQYEDYGGKKNKLNTLR